MSRESPTEKEKEPQDRFIRQLVIRGSTEDAQSRQLKKLLSINSALVENVSQVALGKDGMGERKRCFERPMGRYVCLNMCLSRSSELSCILRRFGSRVHLGSSQQHAFRLTSLMTNEGFQPSKPSPLLSVRQTRLLLSVSLTRYLSPFVYCLLMSLCLGL